MFEWKIWECIQLHLLKTIVFLLFTFLWFQKRFIEQIKCSLCFLGSKPGTEWKVLLLSLQNSLHCVKSTQQGHGICLIHWPYRGQTVSDLWHVIFLCFLHNSIRGFMLVHFVCLQVPSGLFCRESQNEGAVRQDADFGKVLHQMMRFLDIHLHQQNS